MCDCNDLFASDVPDEVINEILSAYIDTPAQLFFQTKNPLRLCEFIDTIPKGAIICTTIETNRMYHEKMGFTSLPQTRAFAMSKISDAGFQTQVTIEPIMDFDFLPFIDLIKDSKCQQVNIGADSSRNNLPEPSKEKLLALIEELQKFTTIARKTNLARLLK